MDNTLCKFRRILSPILAVKNRQLCMVNGGTTPPQTVVAANLTVAQQLQAVYNVFTQLAVADAQSDGVDGFCKAG